MAKKLDPISHYTIVEPKLLQDDTYKEVLIQVTTYEKLWWSVAHCLKREETIRDLDHTMPKVRLPKIKISPPPRSGFLHLWELLPMILPRSIRRVYDPLACEMPEDFLRERPRWRTKWARRYFKFSFTMRTLWTVIACLGAVVLDKGRKLLLLAALLFVGPKCVAAIRESLFAWLGRLP